MKGWLLFCLSLIALAFASALCVWNFRADWLPDKIPTHWGVNGEPDAWAQRDGVLPSMLLTPGVMVGMFLLALAIPWLSPEQFKIEPFITTYRYIMALVLVMIGYMHVVLLLAYTQQIQAVDRWITGGALVGIAALGNVMGKVQKNFYVGIRTPWTLASDTVWIRTHRLGAWMFTIGGVLGLILMLLGVHPLICLSLFGVAAIVPVVYSLLLYKSLEKRGLLETQTSGQNAGTA